jgi:hypothetical protein
MKLSDWIAGVAIFVGGTILYLTNYKRSDPPGRVRSRVGMGLMVLGALLSVGQWVFHLVMSGH